MPGPQDSISAGRSLRASDADRDQAVDVLKAAFADGRLAEDEFDLRVGQALVARTYADLDVLTGGIPALAPAPALSPAPAPAPRMRSRQRVPLVSVIVGMARTRRRLIFLGTGLLLLFAGMALPNPVVFISGMLIVAASAPDARPAAPEAATIRMWQSLYRRQVGRPNG